MKKIISFIAITALLFACSKTEITTPEDSEAVAIEKAKGGNGGGGGGGGPEMTVTTYEASYVLPFGATCGGEVSSSGGGDKVTERGICFSTDPNPTIDDETVPSGSGSGTFTSILSWLEENTTYYVRAYANKSKKGVITTTYGEEESFTTPEAIYGTVTDIDGNTYTTIEIGDQVWMMENLKTTKYKDGTAIPNVTDDVSWAGLSTGAYCDYDNDPDNSDTYGRLYNGYAVDDPRNIAPEGWHVATGDDVYTLIHYVSGTNPIMNGTGARLKEVGTDHWQSPNAYADNSSVFTALPGGFRMVLPTTVFMHLGSKGIWWATGTWGGAGEKNYFYMRHDSHMFYGSGIGEIYPRTPTYDLGNGYSVRCVQD